MEPLIFLLAGLFWIISRYNVVGGVFLLSAAAIDIMLPESHWVALPLIGVIVALIAKMRSAES